MYPTRKQISRWVYLSAKSHETHSNGVSEVGSMLTSTRHRRLEGGDAIPIREEGTSAGFIQLGVDDNRTPGEQQNDALRYPTAHVRDFSRAGAAECQGAGIAIAFGIRRFPNSDDPDIPFIMSLRAGPDEVELHRG